MIMSIDSMKTGHPLFINVDLDWSGQGHTFNFPPNVKEEANCVIHTLLPFLRYHYPEESVDSYFNPETIDRCIGLKVNEETGLVEDSTLIDEEIDDEELMGFTIEMSQETMQSLMRPNRDPKMPYDDDSVSTLGGQPQKRRKTTTINLADDNSTTSKSSSITTSTLKTVESDLRNLKQHVDEKTAATKRKCDDILAKISSLSAALLNEQTSGDRAAGSSMPRAGAQL